MKIEACGVPKQGLEKELFYLASLQGSRVFPLLIDAGQTQTHFYAVLELLGPPSQRYVVIRRIDVFLSKLRSGYHLRCFKHFAWCMRMESSTVM
jgi:hypothetical protein